MLLDYFSSEFVAGAFFRFEFSQLETVKNLFANRLNIFAVCLCKSERVYKCECVDFLGKKTFRCKTKIFETQIYGESLLFCTFFLCVCALHIEMKRRKISFKFIRLRSFCCRVHGRHIHKHTDER